MWKLILVAVLHQGYCDRYPDSSSVDNFTGVYSYIGSFIAVREAIFTVSLGALVVSWYVLMYVIQVFLVGGKKVSKRLAAKTGLGAGGGGPSSSSSSASVLDGVWGAVTDSLDKWTSISSSSSSEEEETNFYDDDDYYQD